MPGKKKNRKGKNKKPATKKLTLKHLIDACLDPRINSSIKVNLPYTDQTVPTSIANSNCLTERIAALMSACQALNGTEFYAPPQHDLADIKDILRDVILALLEMDDIDPDKIYTELPQLDRDGHAITMRPFEALVFNPRLGGTTMDEETKDVARRLLLKTTLSTKTMELYAADIVDILQDCVDPNKVVSMDGCTYFMMLIIDATPGSIQKAQSLLGKCTTTTLSQQGWIQVPPLRIAIKNGSKALALALEIAKRSPIRAITEKNILSGVDGEIEQTVIDQVITFKNMVGWSDADASLMEQLIKTLTERAYIEQKSYQALCDAITQAASCGDIDTIEHISEYFTGQPENMLSLLTKPDSRHENALFATVNAPLPESNKMVKYLLEQDIDCTVKCDGQTALSIAAFKNYIMPSSLIIAHYAKIIKSTPIGEEIAKIEKLQQDLNYALSCAIEGENIVIIKMLLKHTATIDQPILIASVNTKNADILN